MATGLRNQEIAATLFISEQTVKHHLNRIRHKTGAKDRFEVALWLISREQERVTECASWITTKNDPASKTADA